MTPEDAAASPTPPWRRRAATILAPLAAVLLLVALVTNDAVKDEIARVVTEDLVVHGKRDLVGVQPLIEGAAAEVVGGEVFQDLVRAAVVDLHRAIFTKEQKSIALTVVDVATVVSSALEANNPKLAKKLGVDNVRIEIYPPQYALTITRVAEEIEDLHLILIAVAAALIVVAVTISPQRRRTLILLATSLAIGAFILVVAYQLGRETLLGRIGEPQVRAAVRSWSTCARRCS
jgi:hypothetical protein